MRPFAVSVVFALVLPVSVLACAGAGSDPAVGDDTTSEDALTGRAQIKGSWVAQDGMDTGIDFRPDGTFFRDTARILNGVLVNGASRPMMRDTGRYSVSVKHKTITLHVDNHPPDPPPGRDEVYIYEYKSAPVLNGMYLPGHEPAASLTLTLQPAPTERLAHPYPAQHFKGASSWCTTDQDCKDELKDHTWEPYFLNGSKPKCESGNACVNHGTPVGIHIPQDLQQ